MVVRYRYKISFNNGKANITMTIFDILNNISSSNKDLSQEEGFEKAYNTYMVNKFLSMNPNCVRYVEYMNKYHHLPKRIQYLFYLYSITKRKRYFKYVKADELNIDNIMKYFNCRKELAIQYIKFLTNKEISHINSLYNYNG
jgi:hypothetical protein